MVFDMAAGRTDMESDEYLPRRAGQGLAADKIVADRAAFGRGRDKNFVAIVDQTSETAVGRAAHYDSVPKRKLRRIAAPLPSEVELAGSTAHVSTDYIPEMRVSYGSVHDRRGHSSTESVALALGTKANVPSLSILADMLAVVLPR